MQVQKAHSTAPHPTPPNPSCQTHARHSPSIPFCAAALHTPHSDLARRRTSSCQPQAAPPLPFRGRSSLRSKLPDVAMEVSYPSRMPQHAGPATSHGGKKPCRRWPGDPLPSTTRPAAAPGLRSEPACSQTGLHARTLASAGDDAAPLSTAAVGSTPASTRWMLKFSCLSGMHATLPCWRGIHMCLGTYSCLQTRHKRISDELPLCYHEKEVKEPTICKLPVCSHEGNRAAAWSWTILRGASTRLQQATAYCEGVLRGVELLELASWSISKIPSKVIEYCNKHVQAALFDLIPVLWMTRRPTCFCSPPRRRTMPGAETMTAGRFFARGGQIGRRAQPVGSTAVRHDHRVQPREGAVPGGSQVAL